MSNPTSRLAFFILSSALLGACSSPTKSAWNSNSIEGEVVTQDSFILDAERGDEEAQFRMGLMYEEGRGVAPDAEAAATWYERAARGGHAGAQNNLGLLHYAGRGVPQSFSTAAHWFELAARQGFPQAWTNGAVLKLFGQGVAQDLGGAREMLELAAEAGDHKASSLLRSVWTTEERESQVSFRWFLGYAERGLAHAQLQVGLMCLQGQAPDRDSSAGAAWVERAAEQQLPRAEFTLALLLARGEGLPRDLRLSQEWLERSAAHGYVPARQRLELLGASRIDAGVTRAH